MRIAVAGGTGTVGRRVVAATIARGHDPVILSRSTGVDLLSGEGLAEALAWADVVVDVSGTEASTAAESVRFFATATARLLDAEQRSGVVHHVALSIIGAAKVNVAYYAGKKTQEDLVMASDIPWSLLRSTQFHDFAPQLIPRGKFGPLQLVPSMVSQPVAAAEVAEALVEIAVNEPCGLAIDIAGPRVERMPELVRRYLRATGDSRPVLSVPVPGAWGRSMRNGSLLPGPEARRGTMTFADWLREEIR